MSTQPAPRRYPVSRMSRPGRSNRASGRRHCSCISIIGALLERQPFVLIFVPMGVNSRGMDLVSADPGTSAIFSHPKLQFLVVASCDGRSLNFLQIARREYVDSHSRLVTPPPVSCLADGRNDSELCGQCHAQFSSISLLIHHKFFMDVLIACSARRPHTSLRPSRPI